MTKNERHAKIRELVAAGTMTRRQVGERFAISQSEVHRIVSGKHTYGSAARLGGPLPAMDYAMTLEEIGAQMGVTRERVRQIEAIALRKLVSREHLARARNRLRDAIAELRRVRREGAPLEAEWAAAMRVEGLTGAVEFLEAGRAGDLRAILDDADSRGLNELGSAA